MSFCVNVSDKKQLLFIQKIRFNVPGSFAKCNPVDKTESGALLCLSRLVSKLRSCTNFMKGLKAFLFNTL